MFNAMVLVRSGLLVGMLKLDVASCWSLVPFVELCCSGCLLWLAWLALYSRSGCSPSSIYPGGFVQQLRRDCCMMTDCVGISRLRWDFAVVFWGCAGHGIVARVLKSYFWLRSAGMQGLACMSLSIGAFGPWRCNWEYTV